MNSDLTNLILDAVQESKKTFHVEGFGSVGYANLYAFVPFEGFKHPNDLSIGEVTEGKLRNPASDKRPERITRIA